MGHIIRCLSLADMLKSQFRITVAIQQPDAYTTELIRKTADELLELPATTEYRQDLQHFLKQITATDIIILDGYHFKTDYQQGIKDKNCKLVCIDDLHNWHQLADVVINHADNMEAGSYSSEVYTTFCLGLKYALLRNEFLNPSAKIKHVSLPEKIFISMGASDTGNITEKIMQALLSFDFIKEIHLMIGSVNPHQERINQFIRDNPQISISLHINITATELHALMYGCDVCICPASTISLEACATGTVLISGYTADNQLEILNGLINRNVVFNWGNLNTLSKDELVLKFKNVLDQQHTFQTQLENQKKLIDGKSPQRLLNVFQALAAQRLQYRYATPDDTDIYFKWSNDTLVRQNSFNQQAIEYSNHLKWFQSKLHSTDCKFYLFLNNDQHAVGQVRIDKQHDEIVIGISIDEAFRGMSYGTEMLTSATAAYFREHPKAVIIAYIKVENTPSYNIFKKAGFTDDTRVVKDNYTCYKMNKTLTRHEYN